MTYDDHMYHDAIEDTDCRGHVASACWCRTPATSASECQHQPIPTGTPPPPIPAVAEIAKRLHAVAHLPEPGPRDDGSFVWRVDDTTYLAAPPGAPTGPVRAIDTASTGWQDVGVTTDSPLPDAPSVPALTVAQAAEALRRVATAGRSTTQLQQDARAALGSVNLGLVGVAAAAAMGAAAALENARLKAYALAAGYHVPAFVQDVTVEAGRRTALFGDERKAWESVADDLRAARWTP